MVLVDAASTLNREDLGLLRSLYEAGVPAMVLLSKADLLTPADRDRMTAYVRDQVTRELGLDVPVHPVSTVGADEALLNHWFDREITPLLGQHRHLAESSLRRKIAGLRGAVTDALEALVERRQRGTDGRRRVDAEAARRALDEGDRAVREARTLYQDWSMDREAFLDALLWTVAQAIAGAGGHPVAGGDEPARRVVSDVLVRRGRAVHESVRGLLQTLARSLDGLKRAAPSANADVGAVNDEAVSGLPVPDLDPLRTAPIPSRPFWRPFSSRRPPGRSTESSNPSPGRHCEASSRLTIGSSRPGPGWRPSGSSVGTSLRPGCSGS